MPLVVLFLATSAVFLVLDAIMLTQVMAPLFERHIGPLMADPFRLGPAVVFYLGYVSGLIALVTGPALRSGGPVLLRSVVLGLMCYGTFEFTSWAIIADWHWSMAVIDTLWGGVLTGASGWGGVAIARRLVRA
ncbi:MAG: DUF2177 family protein [Gemmobacter sp.]|uniref:DUF2177 family protein n=1 Tax=Gemmobacter sp. TaxID=1898957 RepID=UPI00391A535C